MTSTTTDSIAIVGCGSAKRDEAVPAKALYTSTYFGLKRAYAIQHCDDWRILSAKHHLVHPNDVIAPYDASLTPSSDSYIGDSAREEWIDRAKADIQNYLESFPAGPKVVVLAGEAYAGPLEDVLAEYAAAVEWPFRQDELEGMFDQMTWLSEQTA
jgi:hypothetical protein